MNRLFPERVVPLLLFFLVSLPFLGQAFHIDDRIYLEIAEQIRQNPFFPYDYPPIFEGLVSPDAASHSHLPLTAYYIALVDALFGGSAGERFLHFAFLIFPLLALWSFYDLSRHFVKRRLAVTLLLAFSPAFAVLSHTLMPDVPLLAFWILALAQFLRLVKEGMRGSTLFLLVAALAGAALLSLLSGGLLLLMAAYLWLERVDLRPAKGTWLLVFGAPLLIWGLWYLRAYLYYDRFVLVNTVLHMGQRSALDIVLIGEKLVSFVVNVGGVFLFPLALWISFRGPWRSRLVLLVFFLSMAPFFLVESGWHWLHIFLFAAFFSSGLLVCSEFARSFRARSSDEWLLWLWFLGILSTCLLLYYAGSVRYVLPALPPVLLLWMRRLERSIEEPYFQRNLAALVVLLAFLYHLPITYGDYRFAETYRQQATELTEKYGSEARQIWFTGEWGFRHYLSASGGELITRTSNQAQPGDLIVKPTVASPWVTLYDAPEYSQLIETRRVRMPFPVRLLDFSSHAGFYSTGWGLLPVSLSRDGVVEEFRVYQVIRPYEGPIPEEERHW